ncbi:MAG: hypothetical protein ABL879_18320 [Devosia sp.]
MTINTEAARKAGPYACNGVLVTFNFYFKIFTASTDLNPVLADSAGVETALVYSTNYTVSMNADQDTNPGGTITTLLAYATGYKITIGSAVPATQTTDIPNNSSFHANVVEQGFDKAVALLLDNKEKLARSIRGPISDEDVLVELPTAANRALKYAYFDSTGQPGVSGGGPGNVPISSAMEPVVSAASLSLARIAMGVPHESLLARGMTGGRLSPSSNGSGQAYSHRPATGGIIYYTPYTGTVLGLYDSGTWKLADIQGFVTASYLSIAALTDDRPFDVFAYYNAGLVALEGVSWASDSARATSLTQLDTVWVKQGDTSRRFLGTCRKRGGLVTTAAPYLDVWNMYNRIPVSAFISDTTDSWTIAASAAWRQVRASAANQIEFTCGMDNGVNVEAHAYARAINSTATARYFATGVGLNSAASNGATITLGASCTSTIDGQASAHLVGQSTAVALGQNYLAWMERGDGTETQTFYGDNAVGSNGLQTGMTATIVM